MYIKKRYSFSSLVLWTRVEIFVYLILSTLVAVLFEILGLKWLQLPWTPIALVGTAVAFLIGFQNNASYGRIWEARQIWGGIVNYSRSWGILVQELVDNDQTEQPLSDSALQEEKRILIYRHIAWLTALRYAMRQKKPWENKEEYRTNREWADRIHIPEREMAFEESIQDLLSLEDRAYILSKTNPATAIQSLQSRHLKKLKQEGHIWEFSFLELEKVLVEFFNLQGKSERIKNFPYPRQYATLSHYFVWIFIILLPFGVIPEFARIGGNLKDIFPTIAPFFVWGGIPFTVIVSWVFSTMQRIGTEGENPFEGSPNDVPISTIARGIEIDLREMLQEEKAQIPAPFPSQYYVQM